MVSSFIILGVVFARRWKHSAVHPAGQQGADAWVPSEGRSSGRTGSGSQPGTARGKAPPSKAPRWFQLCRRKLSGRFRSAARSGHAPLPPPPWFRSPVASRHVTRCASRHVKPERGRCILGNVVLVFHNVFLYVFIYFFIISCYFNDIVLYLF